jgi:hypothetical protein
MTDTEKVNEYLKQLSHPLLDEIVVLRNILKSSNDKINERIKWNAPSYFYKYDLFTFNFHHQKQIRLIFHHPFIVNIKSPILEGDYKDRRIAFFSNMESVVSNKVELERIIQILVGEMDKINE